MEHTLRYCSSRADVWRWYWKAWKAKLWPAHVLVATLVAFVLSGFGFETTNLASLAMWFVVAQLAVTTLFAAIPQIRFKASERVLVVSPEGWSTTVGKKSGSRTWAEVALIAEEDGQVIITGKNGNALIIPPGAFADSEYRLQFIQDIQQWKTAYAG